MTRFFLLVSLFLVCNCQVGCSNSNEPIATQSELEAYAAEHGDLSLDPLAQTEIED